MEEAEGEWTESEVGGGGEGARDGRGRRWKRKEERSYHDRPFMVITGLVGSGRAG